MGEPVLRSREKVIEIFQKQQDYDNPIIGGGEIKQIPGLGFYSVYDKSQQAEDPLIPARYVVTKNGNSYNAWEIDKAIKEIGYYPKSEKEALEVAARIVEIANENARAVGVSPYPIKPRSSDEVPKVTKKEDCYEIVLYTFTPEQIIPFMNIKTNDAYYSKHIVKLGKGVCKIK